MTPASREPDGVVAVVASAIVGLYGDRARPIVDRQIEAAEGLMRDRWTAIRDALPMAEALR